MRDFKKGDLVTLRSTIKRIAPDGELLESGPLYAGQVYEVEEVYRGSLLILCPSVKHRLWYYHGNFMLYDTNNLPDDGYMIEV